MLTTLSTDWLHWIRTNLECGVSPDRLIDAMVEQQIDYATACEAVFSMVSRFHAEPVALSADTLASQRAPADVSQQLSGSAEPVIRMEKPQIIVYRNVLTPDECDRLIEMARPKMRPSTVVDQATGQLNPHPTRVSSGTYFQVDENPFIRKIDRRITALMRVPVENGEPIQILNYQPGGQYRPHFDYFPSSQSGSTYHLARGGQRTATLVIYLNEVTAGGETEFPEIGLKVMPQKGSAVYFSYFHQGQVDPLTLHAGNPVIQGEKWIATKWVRERAYC